MPELLLLRHAKSDWNAGARDDANRPLASRGISAARLMGRFLADARRQPDLILCSTAVRTLETLELAASTGDWNAPIRHEPRLYGATVDDVVGVLRDLGDAGPDRVMAVGHEPWCSGLIAYLIGGGAVRFPTAAMARIHLGETAWQQIGPGCGELRWLVNPKLLAKVM